MSSISSPITVAPTASFTGVSKFASSLQSVLSRSISIASLPLQSLEAGLTTLANQQSALQNLDAPFLNLQQAVTSLQSTVQSGLLNSAISQAGIVTANVAPGASAGNYSIEVDNLGSYSTALSTAGAAPVTDPSKSGISADTSLTLKIGNTQTIITPASSSLQDLASAINSQAGGQVQATLINVGSTGAPDYRLSLASSSLGSAAIDLSDSSGDLISSSSDGSLASYKVAGQSTPITSTSRSITLAPGLTVGLVGLSTAGQPVTISVVNDTSSLAAAFSSFASAYNSAVEAVQEQHGTNAGPLQGSSLLQTLSQDLSKLGTYSNGSPSSALANFGITVDSTGRLSVDSNAFATAANADFQGLLATIGGSSSSGFLQQATTVLASVEDPVAGVLKTEETSVAKSITDQQARIAAEQTTVDNLTTSLNAQIANADATIASLESQVSYVTSLFAAYNGTSSSSSNNGLSTL